MGRGLQAVNHGNQIALWSERVKACRTSGLTVSQWCKQENIPLSSYYAWQRKLFQTITQADAVCFAEVPIVLPRSEKIMATIRVNDLQVELHPSASADFISNLVEALKSC